MVYERIADHIHKNELNQSAIARRAGIKKQAMSDSMRGVRRIQVEEYFAICDVLGVPLDFFRTNSDRKAG